MSREVKKTEAGREYQEEILSKESARLKKTLVNQVSKFDELIKTSNGNPKTVKEELEKLETTFSLFSSTSTRLQEIVSEERAAQIDEAVKMEGESVERISIAARDWLAAQGEVEGDSRKSAYLVETSIDAEVEKEEDKSTEKSSLISMTLHLMRKQSNLQDQIVLIEDLLKVGDAEVLTREVQRVELIQEELLLIGNTLSEGVSMEEQLKISNIMRSSETEVADIVSMVHDVVSQKEEESRSVRSEAASRSSRRTVLSRSADKKSREKELLLRRRSEEEAGIDEVWPIAELKSKIQFSGSLRERRQQEDERQSLRSGLSRRSKRSEHAKPDASKSNGSALDRSNKCRKRREDGGEGCGGNINVWSTTSKPPSLAQVAERVRDVRPSEDERQSLRSATSKRSKRSEHAKPDFSKSKSKRDALDQTFTCRQRTDKREDGSIRSHNSLMSNRLDSRRSEDLKNEQSVLKERISEIQQAIVREIRTVEDMLWAGSSEGLQVKIQHLKNLQTERERYAVPLYNILMVEDASQLSEDIARVDGRIGEIKAMIKTNQRQKNYRGGGSSMVSSRKSGTSVCSSMESVSNHSLDSSVGSRVYAAQRRSKTGLHADKENIEDRFHRQRQEYRDQKVLCREIIRTRNPVGSEEEIQRLEEKYQKMATTGYRLREQLPSLEADEMNLHMETEDAEVFEVKKQMIRQMTKATEGTGEQRVSWTATGISAVEKEIVEDKEKEKLMSEVTRTRTRLENQGSLIDDLLQTNNKEMIDRELHTLDKAFDDFVAIIGQLRSISNTEEAALISMLIAEEDAKVFQKKKLIAKQQTEHAEDRGVSTKKPQTGDTDTAKVDPQNGNAEETDHTGIAVQGLAKLNELMVQTLKLQAAPKVDIIDFKGDPLEYSLFVEVFKGAVENLVDDPKQRLVRLLKHTAGEARDLIKHCMHEDPSTCYTSAWKLLEKEYGSPFKITCAYLEKLKTWPQIRGNDAIGMKTLHRFLNQCLSHQRRSHIDLDSPLTIRSIQLALPVNLQDRWTARVGKIRKRKGVEATFADFVEFVDEESECLSDPVYAREGFKDKTGKVKALATKGKEGEEGGDKKKNKCPVCDAVQHDLDECTKFLAMSPREKKDCLFKLRMCFCCYGNDHLATKCNNKRTCNICGEGHPTGLHGVTFKVSAVQHGGSGMCIVPVRLSHEAWKKNGSPVEIEVYAMLDECSEGTFISESLLDLFEEENKRSTSIYVETVNFSGFTDACAIDQLVVRGSEEFGAAYNWEEIKLPITFTRSRIPMDREDVPTAESLTEWEYLNDVVRTLTGIKDIPLGLLIGNNCPKALEPIEVVASKGGGPYAKRTRLGWCVSNAMREEGSSRLKCSNIKVETKIKDVAIDKALQTMYKEDFVEKESEKRALSKEDRWFQEKMEAAITFSDGHYVLPLPIRTQSGLPEESTQEKQSRGSCKQAEQRKGDHSREELNQNESKCILQDQSRHIPKVSIVSPDEVAAGTAEPHKQAVGKLERTMRGEYVVMPDNRGQALQRLQYTKRKMAKDTPFRDEYCKFMAKLFAAGHARKVPKERLKERAGYIPHHGVYHRTKQKMRVVLDCSAEREGVSLNSKLMQGPDFANSLLGVLLRFRQGLIPVMADIEAMYYQVKIPDEHCKFLRFFWWEDGGFGDEPVEYEMCVHPFGAISSKNCVIFALHQTAEDNKEEFGEGARKTLMHDFYVDDMLKSLDEEERAIQLIEELDGMCKAGGFNLTKFVSTNSAVVSSIPIEKRADGLKAHQIGGLLPEGEERALGLLWDMQEDTFRISICFQSDNGTRRGCLSTISRIHDPAGLICVFVLKGKKILQRMTADSVGWDEKLSPSLQKEWDEWREDILLLNGLKIQRCYKSKNLGKVVDVTLHCFADASLVGYGIACYLRMVGEEGKVEVSLVMGKSRVSPLKPTTVPRLELTAATIAAKIAAMVIEELKIEELAAYYWIDNEIVLGWIFNSNRRFRTFVANRVLIVELYTDKEQWRKVDTKENPADFASRGISPREVDKVETWLYGPEKLRLKEEPWRNALPEVEILERDAEVKTTVNAVAVKKFPILEVLEERISCWHRMVRTLAWVGRFGSKEWRMSRYEEVTVAEIQKAEIKLIKQMQKRVYGEEIEALTNGKKGKMEKLKKLNPFLDEEGVLRVGGRLRNALEDDTFRFPVVIPKGSVATRVLIEWHHKQIEHMGKHATVNRLREQGLWVVNSSKEVGAVVFRCVRCKWLRGRFGNQKMADLPWNRTTAAPPFTYCGVDVFGPMLVKEGRKVIKRYGVMFTCFSLRAVHIELAATLETDSFIQSLRRFIARRGAVREIRSDNGTNFVGADNELKKALEEMDQGKIGNFLTEQGCDYITWERNTPLASHMGGVWERQIRTIKAVLSSLLKSSPRRLDEESLRTFLAEAESIVNSRPLTLESLHDPESQPLTANQILTMKTRVASPPPGVFQGEGVYARKRWRVVQHMSNSFWSRWRKEYLQLLQGRAKWTGVKRNLRSGDVVLLKDDGAPRCQWPLALVTTAHESKDGLVRTVSLRAKGSTFDRPVNKTVLLVAKEAEES